MINLSIAKRHYACNEPTTIALEEGESKLEKMKELSQSQLFPVECSFLLSSPTSERLGAELSDRINQSVERIRKLGLDVNYNAEDQTAGQKFVYQLFEKSFSNPDTVFALCCLDQYPLYTQEQFEPVLDLATRLVRDDKLYANGSRNVPVVLGVHQESSDLRIIHELFHTITCAEKVFVVDSLPPWANPHPAYAKLGESTSGFYFIHPAAKGFRELKQEIEAKPGLYIHPGFAVEYFTALWAGLRRSVVNGYVYAVVNDFYKATPLPEEDIKKWTLFIEQQAQALSGTSIAGSLRETLLDPAKKRKLDEFFVPSQVEQVAGLMLK